MSTYSTTVPATPLSAVIATPAGVKLSIVALLVAYGAFLGIVAKTSWSTLDKHGKRVIMFSVVCYIVTLIALWQYHDLIVSINAKGAAVPSDQVLLNQYETVAVAAFTLPIAASLAYSSYKLFKGESLSDMYKDAAMQMKASPMADNY